MAKVPLILVVFMPLLLGRTLGAPSADLITSLPGQPPVSFKQYSGYVTIDPLAGRSFFYYFVEAQEDPASKPLTLWLNGGPGCSSVGLGAFTENGPFRPTSNGTLVINPYSWNRVSNILYLDSPAGVGWSYSNTSSDLLTDDTLTARDNFVFLQNWFEEFPEYKSREFFITGESYAGHYAPQLASLVVDYNKDIGEQVFNFTGLAIGNPLLNGIIDDEATYFYVWTHGLISDDTYAVLVENCNFSIFAYDTEVCILAALEADAEISNYINAYDVLIDVCLPALMHQEILLKRPKRRHIKKVSSNKIDVCIDDEITSYMNMPEVQRAFHANITGVPYTWGECSNAPLVYDEYNFDDSMLPYLAHILEAGIHVLVYSGDADTVVPFIGTRKQINELASLLNLQTTVPYSAWFQDGQVGGWTQCYGNLSYVTVRGAAHMVPYSNPDRALTLFISFLEGTSLPLGGEYRLANY